MAASIELVIIDSISMNSIMYTVLTYKTYTNWVSFNESKQSVPAFDIIYHTVF